MPQVRSYFQGRISQGGFDKMSKRRINNNVAPSHPDCERCKKQRERYKSIGIPRMELNREQVKAFIKRKRGK